MPASGPAFSVIVPTCGRPVLLAEALASVAAQSDPDFECLVIDDGSATAASVVPDDDRFIMVELATNGGASRARNEGLRRARGRWVAFLDDDDRWTPERLALARIGLAHADVVVCGSRWLHQSRPSELRRLNGNVHDVILDRFTPNLGQTALDRTRALPFNEHYLGCQDIDWWLRITDDAIVTTIDDVGLLSRAHQGVRSTNGFTARVSGSERLLAEHRDYFADHSRARARIDSSETSA